MTVRLTSSSTYQALAQLMKDMLYPQLTEIPPVLRAKPNRGGTIARRSQTRHQSRDLVPV